MIDIGELVRIRQPDQHGKRHNKCGSITMDGK
jgi:hypothetical protein